MDKKEIIIKLIRSVCLAIVFGFIILILSGLFISTVNQNKLLEKPEFISWISAVLFFFVIIFVPLPKNKNNLFAVIRSSFITLLIDYLMFVGGRQIQGLSIEIVLAISTPLLLIALILFSWK
ncbi:MAG: hypothetical protein WC781_00095 [Candidatus Pacearchaeota archaeon]|jgi:hypothetical protein